MKFRVKFKCYWYNTGAADNHYYTNTEDFDTLEEAETFKKRVDKQYNLLDRRVIISSTDKPTEHELKHNLTISFDELEAFKGSEEFIEIENGFIDGMATIVKFYPEREEAL